MAAYFSFLDENSLPWEKIVNGTLLTTSIWVVSIFVTPPTSQEKLVSFYKLIKPQGPGWKPIAKIYAQHNMGAAVKNNLPTEILCVLIAAISVYAALFAVGNMIYGHYDLGVGLMFVTAVGTFMIFRLWGSMSNES